MLSFSESFNLHVEPQGSVGATSRATLMDLYAGITLDNPSAITGHTYFHFLNMGAY